MTRAARLMLIIVGALGMSACVVAPPPHYGPMGGPAVVVRMPPPPPRVEVIPVQPYRESFWIPGYWRWEGNQHHWTEGRWERHRERERWVDHRWERDEHGCWQQHGGHWRQD